MATKRYSIYGKQERLIPSVPAVLFPVRDQRENSVRTATYSGCRAFRRKRFFWLMGLLEGTHEPPTTVGTRSDVARCNALHTLI